jgi:hypothetical protein
VFVLVAQIAMHGWMAVMIHEPPAAQPGLSPTLVVAGRIHGGAVREAAAGLWRLKGGGANTLLSCPVCRDDATGLQQ